MIKENDKRSSLVRRKTNETLIEVKIDLDGKGLNSIDTGIPFFDHMLEQLSKHSLIDIELKCEGDLQIDAHHTMEDIGWALGKAINDALGDKRGINWIKRESGILAKLINQKVVRLRFHYLKMKMKI